MRGGIFWRLQGEIMDASLEACWLVNSSEAVRCVVVVVLASLVGHGATLLYEFLCSPKLRGQSTLLAAEAEAKMEVGENFEESK